MTDIMTQPTAIIYDWDNTLADTFPVIVKAMNITLQEMGHPQWTEEEARNKMRKSLRDSFPILFGDDWLRAKDIFYAAFVENHIEFLAVMPGADELTSYAQDRGIRQFVLSNKTGKHLVKEVDHTGWRPRFESVVGADVAPNDKPHPDSVDWVLKDSGLQPGLDIWFVGDTYIDMQCARESGLTAVAIRPKAESVEEFSEWTPHIHVQTATELRDLLQKLS